MATIQDIKQRAQQVKDATQIGENTANRVGGVLVDLCDYEKDTRDGLPVIATAEDFNNPTQQQAAKVPTVGAIIGRENNLRSLLDITKFLEIGNVGFFDDGRWNYSLSTSRVRLSYNAYLYLDKGDIIKLSDYSDARMYIGWRGIDGQTGMRGWTTTDFTVQVAGRYCILLSYNPETETNIEALKGRLRVYSKNGTISALSAFWENSAFNVAYGIIGTGGDGCINIDTANKTVTIPSGTTLVLKSSSGKSYETIDTDVVLDLTGLLRSSTAIVIYYDGANKDVKAVTYSNFSAQSTNYVVATIRYANNMKSVSSLIPYSIDGNKYGCEGNGAFFIQGKKTYIDYQPLRRTLTIPNDVIIYYQRGGAIINVSTSEEIVINTSMTSTARVVFYDVANGTFGVCAYSAYKQSTGIFVAGIRQQKSGYSTSISSSLPWSINGNPYGVAGKAAMTTSPAKIMAHRGAHFNAVPENSLDSYVLAGLMGYDFAETDFCQTADGVLVLMHDDSINRTMRNKSDYSTISETVNVADVTYADLVANYVLASDDPKMRRPIPTLEEYFITCKESGVFPVAEIKNGLTEQKLYEAFMMGKSICGDGNFGFISDEQNLLDYIRTLSDTIPLLYLGTSIINTTTAGSVSRNHPKNIWYPSYSSAITESVIREYRANGMEVGLWLLGSYANNFDAMIKVGASIICCDVMAPNLRNGIGVVYDVNDFSTTGTIDDADNVIRLDTNQRITLYMTTEQLAVWHVSVIGKGKFSVTAPSLSASNVVENVTYKRNMWQGVARKAAPTVEIKASEDGVVIESVLVKIQRYEN